MKKLILVASLILFAVVILFLVVLRLPRFFQSASVSNNQTNTAIPPTIYQISPKSQSTINPLLIQPTNIPLTLFTDNELTRLNQLQSSLPYRSTDLTVTYSPLLNQYLVVKQSDQADEKIISWAKEHGINDLITDKNLFVIDQSTQTIDQKETVYQKNRELSLLTAPTIAPTAVVPQTDNETQTFRDLFALLFNIDVPSLPQTTSPARSSSSGSPPGTLTTPTPSLSPTTSSTSAPSSRTKITSLQSLISEAAQKVNVPEKIIEGIISIENPAVFNLSDEEITRQSTPDNNLTCLIASCSEQGPMQMTTGRDRDGRTDCPQCCWNGQCIGYCPNAWSIYGHGVNTYGGYSHAPNPCDLRDNIYAAALKLKTDSGAANATNWTREEVNRAGLRYHGNCSYPYERLGNRTYCDYLWWYYQNL